MGGGHLSRPDFGMPQPDPAHPLTEFYLLLALIGGLFIEKSNGNPVVSGIGLVLGDAACYVLGTAWFVFQMQCELGYALSVCVYPFIALDLAKIVVSCVVGALLRKRLVQAGVLKMA